MAFEKNTGHGEAYYRVMKEEEDIAEGKWLTGCLYMCGMGTARDPVTAVKWFERAALANDAFGLLALSLAHEHGLGTPVHKGKALLFLRKAIAVWGQGLEEDKKPAQAKYYWDAFARTGSKFQYASDTRAHLNLFRALAVGRLDALAYLAIGMDFGYFTIKGFSSDKAKLSLLEKAAELEFWHCAVAQFLFRSDCPQTHTKTYQWLKAGIKAKYAQSSYWYGGYFAEEEETMSHFIRGSALGCIDASTQVFSSSPECKRLGPMAAGRRAYEGLLRGARQGSPECMALVGRYHVSGTLVQKNLEEGFAWGLRAIQYDSPAAMCFAADCYMAGWGCARDFAAAVKLYEKSAAFGFSLAKDRLGQCYQHGYGVKVDYAKARAYYEQLPNEADSLLSLAFFYRYGLGGPMRQLDALKRLTESAMGGNALAAHQLLDGEDHVKDRLNLLEYLDSTQGRV